VPKNGLGKKAAVILRRSLKYGHLRPFDVEVWGQRLRLLSSGNVSGTKLLYLPHFFDPLERDLLQERLRPGSTFVDVGANEGAYTFWCRSLLGKRCSLIAVEPDPELRTRLNFNLAENGAEDVSVLPYAISDQSGRGRLSICEANRGENRLLTQEPERRPGESIDPRKPAEAQARVSVQVRTLEEALGEVGCEKVHAMKVDVEGHEETVLAPFFRSAPESIWPSLLLMEYKAGLPAHKRVLSLLEKLGYRETLRTRMNLAVERTG
jgi:FkbM family methyltransferase